MGWFPRDERGVLHDCVQSRRRCVLEVRRSRHDRGAGRTRRWGHFGRLRLVRGAEPLSRQLPRFGIVDGSLAGGGIGRQFQCQIIRAATDLPLDSIA